MAEFPVGSGCVEVGAGFEQVSRGTVPPGERRRLNRYGPESGVAVVEPGAGALLGGDALGSGPGRLTTDVEDVRTGGKQRQTVLHRAVRVVEGAAENFVVDSACKYFRYLNY